MLSVLSQHTQFFLSYPCNYHFLTVPLLPLLPMSLIAESFQYWLDFPKSLPMNRLNPLIIFVHCHILSLG